VNDGPIEVDRLIDEAPAGRLLAKVVALCALAGFLDGYDIQAISVAIPAIAEATGRAAPSFVPAITASLAGTALGAMFLSPLADRFGRRPLIIVLLALVGLSSLGAATAQGIYDLAVWRFFTGAGIGGCVPVASALIAEYSPKRRRAQMITLLACSIGVGATTAGLVAPNLSAAWGWKGIFVVGGALPLAAALVFVAVLPESLPLLLQRRPGDPRIARIARHFAPGIDPARLVVRKDAGERHSVLSLLSPTYRARTLLVWSIISMNLFVNYVIISWLPTLMRQAGWSLAAAQRSIMISSLGGIVAGLLLSWAADRGRPIRSLAIGYATTTVALALFPFVPPTGLGWGTLILLAGAGAFGAQFTLTSVSASYYPGPIRATGLGWTSAMGRVGSIAGPTVIGLLMAQSLPTATVLALLTAPMAICAVAVTLLPWTLRNGDEPPGLSGRLQTET
jgi:AAHS family 4-hydroxybenzoate transporter-like MFS transporter